MGNIIDFFKKDAVLSVSVILALVSSFFVFPSAEYFSYIDFNTLALLFCLMAVMEGYKKAGVFDVCAHSLLNKTSSARGLSFVLVMLCFVFSAFITNDVALITFVPLSVATLTAANRTDILPLTVVLQTIAANMGSCLTPIGNPQNIYLYSISDIGFYEFFITMLPFGAVSLVFVLIGLLFIKQSAVSSPQKSTENLPTTKALLYTLLFVISLLGVLNILNCFVCLGIILVLLVIFDRHTLLRVDYSLLLTFVGFFVFVGNMGRMPLFNQLIQNLIEGREILFSALSSQIISNVPAALLLSGFTDNFRQLLIGVNIGGLGTLIASMASIISYKYIAAALPHKKGKYFLLFTVLNFILLCFLLLLVFITK